MTDKAKNDSFKRPLAKLLRDSMERNHFTTTKDLAKRVNLSEEHIRRMLRGTAIPTNQVLREICELVGVNYKEAHALALEQRDEEALIQYATQDDSFRAMVQLWRTDPSISSLAEKMIGDQQLYMLVKLWGMLSVEKRGILFKAAVALTTKVQATAA